MSSTNLNVTVAHAISFLVAPLQSSCSQTTISTLRSVLEANLIALYAPTWAVKNPMSGSGRRCLTLSPACLPSRSIYSACIAAGIQWFDWIKAVGGREFNLYVDPGCVAVKFASPIGAPSNPMITIWADEVVAPALPTPRTGLASFSVAQNAAIRRGFCDGSKTMAQQLLEEDDEDEKLFDMIADEVSGPTWVPPIVTQFGASNRSPSPLSSIGSSNSRCSSRSSNSSSSSLSYGSDMLSSASSIASHSHLLPAVEPRQPRREQKPRAARVFIDNTKTEVTPYDGGKTTVLTGGVMLGGGPKAQKPKKPASASSTSSSWRSARV